MMAADGNKGVSTSKNHSIPITYAVIAVNVETIPGMGGRESKGE
jgi:hypothetical protein